MASGDWIYFATDPKCGHIVAAVVDDPNHRKDTAKNLAEWVRDGYTITRGPSASGKGINWCSSDCPRMKEFRKLQAEADARKAKRQRSLSLSSLAQERGDV